MPHWDEDSAQLRTNLQRAQAQATAQGIAREPITVLMIQAWHATTMEGLDIPEQEIPADEHGNKPQAQDFFGQLRGSAKLHHINVAVRDGERQLWGEHPASVAAECKKFIDALRQECEALDLRVPRGRVPDDQDDVFEIAAVVAWAHNEWARIHPFGNGNGRTARLLANMLLVRYGLPRVFRLRPRPEWPYADAAIAGMDGDDTPMAAYILVALRQWQPAEDDPA
jgi:hypothetical protein